MLGGLDELDDLLDDLGPSRPAPIAKQVNEDDIDDLMFGRAGSKEGRSDY